MTAHELANKLLEGPDLQVILSKDAEGNTFSPFCEASQEVYEPSSTWSGDIRSYDTDEEKEQDTKNALVLWPIN